MFESTTIIDDKGKVLLFSVEDFYTLIVKGNHCFICGAPPTSKPFNDEHIIPDWILRRYNLYNKQMKLPNQTHINYGKYTVPCCRECNSELGDKVEKPISELLKKSYEEINHEIEKDFTIIYDLFRWMCLMYLKTHLKDTRLRMERDHRIDAGMIGDYHAWEGLHHIHCVARSYHTQAKIDYRVYGTMFFVPAFSIHDEVKFDYLDSHDGKTMLIQLDDFCMITVLDDSCAGYSLYMPQLEKITGPLTSYQSREIVSHLHYINTHLKNRPKFYSNFSSDGYEIKVEVPNELELLEPSETEAPTLGQVLHFYVRDMVPLNTPNRDQVLEEIKSGKRGYLFNQNGEFQDPRKSPDETYLS